MIEIEHRDYRATLRRCVEVGGSDLIITSPPYPAARPGQYRGDTAYDWTWSDYEVLGDAVCEGLKPGGFCAVVIDGPIRCWRDKSIGTERSLIAFKLAIDWAERVGLRYVEHCAYVRDGPPGSVGDRWRSGWEPVHVFQRPGYVGPGRVKGKWRETGATGWFDASAFTLPAKNPGKTYGPARARAGHSSSGWMSTSGFTVGEHKQITTAISGYVNGGTIFHDHPAPFANWLADAFVLCYCPPGGIVCDPFTGSGTVAISAAKHGRRFIGGDLGARESDGRRWADIALERAIAERDRPKQVGLALD